MMKTLKYKFILLSVLVIFIFSCNDNDKFENELYKTQVYLVSGESNIKQLEYSLDSVQSVRYISVAYSGTSTINNSIKGNVQLAPSLIDKYNYSNFDIDEEKYAHHFEAYEMPSNEFEIKGDKDGLVYGLMPIYIKGEDLKGLSPDSTYFIPLKLNDVEGAEISESKNNVLARVYFRNRFASVKEQTIFRAVGYTESGGGTPSAMSIDKVMHPISKNEVRIFAGANNYNGTSKSLNRDIKQLGLVIKVNEDNTLTLSSSDEKEEFMQVEQLTPPDDFLYKNIYNEAENSFFLYYKYRSYEYKDYAWRWSNWYTVRERVEKY